MVNILEVTVVWTGFTGAPGYTNLHTTAAGLIQTAVDNSVTGVHDFFTALAPNFPAAMKFDVQGEVKEFDPVTGNLAALHAPSSAPTQISGSSAYAFGAAPAGACIAWTTGGLNRFRRVRGRTFLVPLASNVFQDDGTLVAANLTSIRNAATGYRTSGAYESLIWSRPIAHAGGAAFPILTSAVADKVAVLRSRRD